MSQKRIVVPLSVGDSGAAFERALAVARISGAELYLLHAVPADQRYSFDAAERLRRSTAFRQRADAVGVTIETVEQQGDSADLIVLHAESRDADLIVMESARRSGWARFRQPSVAERVLRRTKRPTLIIRGRDGRRDSEREGTLPAPHPPTQSASVIETLMRLSGNDPPLLVPLGSSAARMLRTTDRAVLALPDQAHLDLNSEGAIHRPAA
jgi:nucleotide-binding universal stress UspA family protein